MGSRVPRNCPAVGPYGGAALHFEQPRDSCVEVGRVVRFFMGEVPLHRGTSPIRNRLTLGTYSRTMPRALWWSVHPRPEIGRAHV